MSQESFYANLAKWEYVSLGVKGDKVQELVEAGHIKMDGSGPDRLFVNIPIICACQRKPAARHHARAPRPVVLLPPPHPASPAPATLALTRHLALLCPSISGSKAAGPATSGLRFGSYGRKLG